MYLLQKSLFSFELWLEIEPSERLAPFVALTGFKQPNCRIGHEFA
ncbi:hypothetical protein SAMN04489725_11061 [Alicyclobacillus hesperidum]|uniref:Uncharacterized protein n=1 Tax=Alicyclobacillus hesperidum TaxID=89784 RepID=A0A1H2VB86_9BACL|nr:hypothetical protein SAMN04489725_11061 [Alicyclobacillus hesperidum]